MSLMKGINHPSLDLFKKQEYIAQGGFGHVWKVLFLKGDYYLAMKQISKKEIYQKRFISNIFSERDILNILYNIHIVNLYLTFQDENYLYMIMDYLEGGDLRKQMKEKVYFNIREIKFIAACIIIGLEYIHRKGVIHRDIKPENLIFDEKGYLRISDFGIAIRNNASKLEKNNDKSGTPGYMAPERIINNLNISYTYSSDYFSLGVILYELIMNKKPFRRNADKIGKIQYNNLDDIIQDFFNNENINLTPSIVKNYRNKETKNNSNIFNIDELTNLCDLINKLLVFDQKNRLGYNNIGEIKNHPFFGERFEWKKIYHRSLKSPFNSYEFCIRKKKENDDIDLTYNKLFKNDKIHFSSTEETMKFQKNFENFTLIHKIRKEDFNYFYVKADILEPISKNRNDSNALNKLNNSLNKRNIKALTTIPKKNLKFLSQTKKAKKENLFNLKYKIMPNKLFKENNNKIYPNKNNINSDLIKNNSPKIMKIPVEIIEENFMNNYLSKTNFNFHKIKNFQNNIKLNKNSDFPMINSGRERESRKTFIRPSSTNTIKKRHSNSIDNYKKHNKLLFVKNSFKDNYFNFLMHQKNKNKSKNDHYLTDSNNNITNSLKTSRKNEKSNLLKNSGNLIIAEQYRDKIIKINNNNIDKALKSLFVH